MQYPWHSIGMNIRTTQQCNMSPYFYAINCSQIMARQPVQRFYWSENAIDSQKVHSTTLRKNVCICVNLIDIGVANMLLKLQKCSEYLKWKHKGVTQMVAYYNIAMMNPEHSLLESPVDILNCMPTRKISRRMRSSYFIFLLLYCFGRSS